ncbi:DUF4145 domain-containing protein [Mycolicibacterium fortuitum]|uniref:DUF4145 domain-containing protein n=2 Tax=Mycolicibacterium fortuitum TaxID=1766 RepID=A0AAE4VLN8_MYCFO|nr:DUF4145 domain-containing protein [Mycolicibacterium fortuitum]MCV7143090.1 DUF4145 domain-containing protein [Mycolicibacterium fortuitum]MDV7195889.1 DUF4145 domain-containing protein [Mycolicibacterium fortuitum]MDV7209560.1 DUF4145 domain-containing protein [Mycolicibacterium fortuitum]MDV7231391.1 DUF4145 domain-containing protein [Mycolicibacterium fortuitum]MDV7262909.1 DUF4145 domain-containing protein [Mycolicibacterium fortuitum]
MPKYIQPAVNTHEFTCPFCETLVSQWWRAVYIEYYDEEPQKVEGVHWCQCGACGQVSWWIKDKLVHPRRSGAPPAQEGMPADVLSLYEEAVSIADLSPRSASALLRTALEVLTTNHLGQQGVKLNDAIGSLVRDGRLDESLQQAMDYLRLTGNGAVHPREVQLDDQSQSVEALFELLNLVVERLVYRPQRIAHLYAQLPESKRQAVEERDSK